jgi:hypothetical protein
MRIHTRSVTTHSVQSVVCNIIIRAKVDEQLAVAVFLVT